MTNYTILLIDYEPRSIERFRQPLTSAGYRVEIATDGIAGIEAFTRLNPDMVLVEAMIPKKHGFEVCQELKRTPHGRRTPIIITTGVYKGRKYRSQALHIYGCDEYIEKPIAPEQLLAVVGKFFGGAHSGTGPSQSSAEASGDAPDPKDDPGPSGPPAGAAPSRGPEPSASGSGTPQMKTVSMPAAVVSGLTEEEIMARLDAILPGGENALLAAAPPAVAVAEMAAVETIDLSETEADVDPFRRMRDELNSELGALSAALAFDPAPVLDSEPEPAISPIPSDQTTTPSLLESLPLPEAETPAPTIATPTPSERDSRPSGQGQVVNFDAKRSKKSKKGGKKGARAGQPSAPAPVEQPPAAHVPTPPPSIPVAEMTRQRRVPNASEIVVPYGSVVETELGAPAKRPVPAWIWIAVTVAALAGGYVLLGRGGASPETPAVPGDASQAARSTRTEPPSEAPVVPAPTLDQSSPSVETSREASIPQIRPTKPAPVPKPAATPPRSETASPVTTKPVPTLAPSVAEAKAPPAPRSAPVVLKPQVVAPSGLDAGTTTGVESVAGAPAELERPSVAPGTMLPIDQVDTLPVSLSRIVPIYSLRARQMRVQGTVVLNVLINDKGTVDDVVIAQGLPGGDVNEAAVKAAKQWTYRPATKDGVAVKVWKSEFVNFKL
jgi:TonB family protein